MGVLAAAIVATQSGQTSLRPQDGLPAIEENRVHRIIRHFDFDERSLGNLESVPMYWVRHVSLGFPAYAQGRFDTGVGHEAPPSFYLNANGRSCAYEYSGLDIQIEPSSEYRVTGWLKPDRMRYTRAYLSAFLLDANGRRIHGTERRSRLVGGEEAKGWEEVTVRLPSDVVGAYSIGLAIWVVQRALWSSKESAAREIDHRDIDSGVWLDDIVVFRLPSVELSSEGVKQGRVYSEDESPVLLAKIGDAGRRNAKASLTIRDSAGAIAWTQALASSVGDDSPTHRVEVPPLGPGIYHAYLRVELGQEASIDRYLTFPVIAASPLAADKFKPRLGIMLEPHPQRNWRADQLMLSASGVQSVKLPLPLESVGEQTPESLEFDRLAEHLISRNVEVTGMLTYQPEKSGAARSSSAHSLVDSLSLASSIWRPHLVSALTRYENRFQQWQIGTDGLMDVFGDPRLDVVLGSIRAELAKLTTVPVMVVPWSAQLEPTITKLHADILSIAVPADTPPYEIPGAIDEPFRHLGYRDTWALLEAPDSKRYRRLPRLADFAKRLIYALQSQAARIFVRQPWLTRRVGDQSIVEPDENLLVLRTVASLLGDATYLGPLEFGDSITCHAYDRHGVCVLVMWDDHAPAAGRNHQLDVSGATRATDLWGNVTALGHSSAKSTVRLSPVPVFVEPAETWLVQFRQALRFEPELLPSEYTFHEQQVRIYNPRSEPISGMIRLKPPPGWQSRPTQFAFAIQPHETFTQPIRMQSSPREPAGRKRIEAEVVIDASRVYEFSTYLPLELGLSDMDVWLEMVVEGQGVIVRHGVTNRSAEVVTFRSYADAPGRKRRSLNMVGLQPGQTIVKSHYFDHASELSGQVIRVRLQQVKGPRSHNLTVTVP